MFDNSYQNITNNAGASLTSEDLKQLAEKVTSSIPVKTISSIRNGGDFMQAAVKYGVYDDCCTSWNYVGDLIKQIGRHDILHMLRVRPRTEVREDLLDNYFAQTKKSASRGGNQERKTFNLRKRAAKETTNDEFQSVSNKRPHTSETNEVPNTDILEVRNRTVCDLRLHVRADFDTHETALQQNVGSNNPDPTENQLECLSQAFGVVRGRELGCLVCQVQFAELTFLDAFWRDYMNGSLAKALRGVFITDALRRVVGDEPVRLHVYVSDDDYQRARRLLSRNLDL